MILVEVLSNKCFIIPAHVVCTRSIACFIDPDQEQLHSQHCLSTALALAVSFSTLIGLYLNDGSVRKVLKTPLRYEISDGLQLQSTKENELQFTRKQLLDNEMFNLQVGMFLGWQRK